MCGLRIVLENLSLGMTDEGLLNFRVAREKEILPASS